MKLYYSPGACSLASHIALCEAGLSFEIVRVDLSTKKLVNNHEDFLKVNPKGQVPTLLLDNNNILTEGVAVMQYIADQAPTKNLMPSAPSFDHYKTLEWLNFIATELHKNFGPFFRPGYPDEIKNQTKEQIQHKLAYIDKSLKGHDYLIANQFTIVDGYLFTVLRWAKAMQFDLETLSDLTSYFKRVENRPAVQKALSAEA